jgi:hypothetical protein
MNRIKRTEHLVRLACRSVYNDVVDVVIGEGEQQFIRSRHGAWHRAPHRAQYFDTHQGGTHPRGVGMTVEERPERD